MTGYNTITPISPLSSLIGEGAQTPFPRRCGGGGDLHTWLVPPPGSHGPQKLTHLIATCAHVPMSDPHRVSIGARHNAQRSVPESGQCTCQSNYKGKKTCGGRNGGFHVEGMRNEISYGFWRRGMLKATRSGAEYTPCLDLRGIENHVSRVLGRAESYALWSEMYTRNRGLWFRRP